MTIEKLVYESLSKYEKGLTGSEIKVMLDEHFPSINMVKFNNAMIGITCNLIDEDIVFYHCDVALAIHCGVENRDIEHREFEKAE